MMLASGSPAFLACASTPLMIEVIPISMSALMICSAAAYLDDRLDLADVVFDQLRLDVVVVDVFLYLLDARLLVFLGPQSLP